MRRRPLPFDTHERHAVVADLLGSQGTVLDVGGRPGELRSFLPHTTVTALNVDEPADMIYDGSVLPVDDGSFDAVVSIDVLEHLPRDERRHHLQELVRVARTRVVACCPLGTPEHVEAERELAVRHPHPFLAEHLAHGLPTEPELRSLSEGVGMSFELWFHGDFRTANEQFVLERETRALRPRALVTYALQRARWAPDLVLARESTPFTNRAYLVGTS